MNQNKLEYVDVKTDVKVVLAGLWTAMMFIFAYVDIFSFWRADVINGALTGEVPGQGITIGQGFLAAATGFILIPTLMIAVSLVAPARLNRILNLVISTLYAVVIAALCIGEEWTYYLLGSFFEVVLLIGIVRTAWTWPTARRSAHIATRSRRSVEPIAHRDSPVVSGSR